MKKFKSRRTIAFYIVAIVIVMGTVYGCKKGTKKDYYVPDEEIVDPGLQENITEFSHPGISGSQARFQEISFEDDDYRSSSFEVVQAFLQTSTMPVAFESVISISASGQSHSFKKMKEDANLAYAYAVKWTKKGIQSDAQAARRILNGWASGFDKFEAEAGVEADQMRFEAAKITAVFSASAEIIRYYKINGSGAGWSANEVTVFKAFLSKMINEYVNKLAEAVDKGQHYNDWGTSAGYAKIAVGVFYNDRALYESGKAMTLKLTTELISATGEIQMLCAQNCMRTQYALAALTYAAEIARLQGDNSIYNHQDQRLKLGWNWLSKAFVSAASCKDCQTQEVLPVIEVAYNYYKPADFSVMRQKKWPYGNETDQNFIGFTSYTHSDYVRVLTPGQWKDSGLSWLYNFGTGTGTGQIDGDYIASGSFVSTKAVPGWLPYPASGEARLFQGTAGNGRFRLVKLGEESALQVTGTMGSLNKFSLYNITEATPVAACFFKVKIDGTAMAPANWRLGLGNNGSVATVFSNSSSIPNTANTDLFTAIEWQPSATDNSFSIRYKQGASSFSEINNTSFIKDETTHYVEIYGNNSSLQQVYVRGGMEYTVPSRNYHIWVDGNKLKKTSNNIDYFPGATNNQVSSLAVGKSINSFMLTSNQVSTEDTFTISNVEFLFK